MNDMIEFYEGDSFANGQSPRDFASWHRCQRTGKATHGLDLQRRRLPSLHRDHNTSVRERRVLEMETSTQEPDLAAIKVFTTRLNYLAEATPKPINYAY